MYRVGLVIATWITYPSALAAEINYQRDVRPILADHCFRCHGPDARQRQAELRLDTQVGQLASPAGHPAIVPGAPSSSELMRRITAEADDVRMPPVDAGDRLSRRQIEIIRAWIHEGAEWSDHWSFRPPLQVPLPHSGHNAWTRNAIDRFIAARLDQEGWQPSPEARKSTLIRRLSLDLTGLPATLDESAEFVSSKAPDAYQRAMDRLLASPHYGEHVARLWLDAARYADTSGYQNDGPRYMWRWRDWVIAALNRNMPFDQFTIEQLAGDLIDPPSALDRYSRAGEPHGLPLRARGKWAAATGTRARGPAGTAWRGKLIRDPQRLERLIATGFNRNHRGNAEGGIVPDEYQVEYVVDRVDTTFTVWLGLTMGCCRCHDHKYDPFKQREFYQAFAYFNNVPEYGRAVKEGNSPPYIKAPTRTQLAKLVELERELAAARHEISQQRDLVLQALGNWQQSRPDTDEDWCISDGLQARLRFDNNLEIGRYPHPDPQHGPSVKQQAAQWVPDRGNFASGVLGQAAYFNGARFVAAGDLADFGYFDSFSLAAWVRAERLTGTLMSRMTVAPDGPGYALHLEGGRLQLNLVKRWLDDSLRVETDRTIALNEWVHVAATYDGSRVADGIRIYVNGLEQDLRVNQHFINQSFAVKDEPLRVGEGVRRFAGWIDDVRVYGRALTANEISIIATPTTIAEIVNTHRSQRRPGEVAKLRSYFLQSAASEQIQRAHQREKELSRRHQEVVNSLPTVMVMQEMSPPRQTYVLARGQYDQPTESVKPGVPATLPPLPDGVPNNRLGFAKWLVSADNPLTARVMVNRFWQRFFGVGIVKTTEDFGSQGEAPSHPELLDWLAVEFRESEWDLKRLQRLIVSSATYRQDSRFSPRSWAQDPDNRLLARGARIRLSAEEIRDQALLVSGLLTRPVGGPSVKPYQPDGLWQEIASDTDYEQSRGSDLYRRSLYTYWKRTVAPPTMVTFDATAREACTVKRSRTNTPLQALALMNEVAFLESARALAQRLLREKGRCRQSRVSQIFQMTTGRPATSAELTILMQSLSDFEAHFKQDLEAASGLLQVGELPTDVSLDVAEVAAYTLLASLVFNLDEVITKE